LTGQVSPAILGSGYTVPSPIYAGPGQLITLIVQGLGNGMSQTVRAPAGANLPTTLAGVSVSFGQGTPGSAPVLEVHPFSPCNAVFLYECNELAAITIQIPFEAQSILPAPTPPNSVTAGFMTVSVASQPNAVLTEVTVLPLADQIHILTSCDPFMNSAAGAPLPTGLPCPQIVAHGDGSLVSAANPAKAGEELVAYAVGLGQTNPASVTGQLVTKSAPTQTTFTLDYNFHPNALPSRPLPNGQSPIFAGTTPGYVGLYQVNFTVPPVPAGSPPCVDASPLPLGSNVVQSNLTVSIGGQFSFDGARICVATN
jgi:uncharacterized protein (TIGR03437 family)